VRRSNGRAIRFYQRNGFKMISRRKNYYRNPLEDAWVMERADSTAALQG
jgi:ribosomal-protein-alanine N-acetyltransferase